MTKELYKIVYDVVADMERRQIRPPSDTEISSVLTIDITGPWFTEVHPELLDAVRRAQLDISEERRVW